MPFFRSSCEVCQQIEGPFSTNLGERWPGHTRCLFGHDSNLSVGISGVHCFGYSCRQDSTPTCLHSLLGPSHRARVRSSDGHLALQQRPHLRLCPSRHRLLHQHWSQSSPPQCQPSWPLQASHGARNAADDWQFRGRTRGPIVPVQMEEQLVQSRTSNHSRMRLVRSHRSAIAWLAPSERESQA